MAVLLREFLANRSGNTNRRENCRTAQVLFGCLFAIISLMIGPGLRAQSSALGPTVRADSATSTLSLFAGASVFIPFLEGYRINYTTKFVGLPIELAGGIAVPLNERTALPITLRYIRREALFAANTTLSTFFVEPGVRIFLEAQRPNDLRFFAGGSLVIAQATFSGSITPSTSGEEGAPIAAMKTYFNLGGALDLGFAYPFAGGSGVDVIIHTSLLFGSPASRGGIGNLGGVSIGGFYHLVL